MRKLLLLLLALVPLVTLSDALAYPGCARSDLLV